MSLYLRSTTDKGYLLALRSSSMDITGTIAQSQDRQTQSASGTVPVTTRIVNHLDVVKYSDIPQSYIDIIKTRWLDCLGESHSYAYRRGLEILEEQESKFAVVTTETAPPTPATNLNLRASRLRWNGAAWDTYTGEQNWYTNATAIQGIKNHIAYCAANSLPVGYLMFGWCWDMSWDGSGGERIGGTMDPVYRCRWGGSSIEGPEGDRIWGLNAADQTLTSNSVCMDTYLAATADMIAYCTTQGYGAKVIFTTGPVDDFGGSTELGYQRSIKQQYIRDYVTANGGTLFDYADILCYNNAGALRTSSWTDDQSTLHTFPEIHTDNVTDLQGNFENSVGHIGSTGALRIGKAAWVLAAYIEGWDGTPATDITGTSTQAQDRQTHSGSGTVTSNDVTGTIAQSQDRQTQSGSGTVTSNDVTGTIAQSQDRQTQASSGTVTSNDVTGTSTQSQDRQTQDGSGSIGITGTSAQSQDRQTQASSGTVVNTGITGIIDQSQDRQTQASTGTVVSNDVTGTIVQAQDRQAQASSGTVVNNDVTGTIAQAQDRQTQDGTGTVTSTDVTGTIAQAQARQVQNSVGTVALLPVTGTSAQAQKRQTQSATSGAIPLPEVRLISVQLDTFEVFPVGGSSLHVRQERIPLTVSITV